MDRCIMSFLDKIFIVKDVVITVPKKEVRICLSFLGKQFFEIRTKRCKFVSLHFPQCKLQVIFNSNNRLRNFLSFKDKIPLSVRSHVLYRYTGDCCKAIYIGKTRRHYGVRRVLEHLGISLAFVFSNFSMMVTLACLVKSCLDDLKCLSTTMELSQFACVLWGSSIRINIVSHFPTYGLEWHKMQSMRYMT